MNHSGGYLASDVQPRSALALMFESNSASLGPRLVWLASVFSLELILLPVLLKTEGPGTNGLGYHVSAFAPWIWRVVVGFAALFVTIAWLKHRPALDAISAEVTGSPISLPFLAAHVGSIAVFCLISSTLLERPRTHLLEVAWLASGSFAVTFAGFVFIRPVFWLRIVRCGGLLWLWAAVAAVLACIAGSMRDSLWPLAAGITLHLSQAVLNPFVSGLLVDPANRIIGTHRFSVEISPECSGLEGISLIAIFGTAWLIVFRKECRFPNALILLPAGVILVFVLNAFRIAALVLIGDAGAEKIAMHGFHTTAGWIVFNLIALGFCVAASRVSWLRVAEPGSVAAVQSFENPTTRWIMPLLTILAVGMISAALTGDFEWFYPLRFFAGAVTLAVLWRRYIDLDWRVGWLAPAVGVMVFFIWIGLDRFTATVPEGMPAPLSAAPPLARNLWLIFRVIAATVTVPIAEEFAFRGFLYRRLLSPDFDSVSFRRFSWMALLASSMIFGLAHGDRWFAASLAGALYSLVLIRRGSIGDAVVAHAITNALLAVDVLVYHRWHLW